MEKRRKCVSSYFKNLEKRGIELKTCDNCHNKFKALYQRFLKDSKKKVMLCYLCQEDKDKFESRQEKNPIVFCKNCWNKYERTGGNRQHLCPCCQDKVISGFKKSYDYRKIKIESIERHRLLTKFNFQNKNIDCLLK